MFLEPRAAPSRRQAWARETSFELLGYLYFGHVGPGTTIGNLSTPKPPSERTSAYKRAQFMGAPSHAEVTVSRIDTRHRLAVIAHEELSAVDPGFCLAYLAHSMLFANNLQQIKGQVLSTKIITQDVREIKKVAEKSDFLELLSRALCC